MTADTDEAGEAAEFEAHRPRLFAVAYRMLGSASEAEDAVQDAYLRWHAADRSAVATPAAWLTTVLTNLITPEHEIRVVEVNGAPAIPGLLPGTPVAVIVPEVGDGGIVALRNVVNPDKLAFLTGQLAVTRRTSM
ncbi:hypothetical protein HDA32_002867 [Spinactinospora alkalitolerans]|uniref:RNA polymerase sigma-70 region 2 domain-containing protein n=1 Tax=Spinactinospora alkalitolerans TaxID=687207 RepID=A0A852TWR1_9ACTN|nr:hypothetical protein [Spinactinospora alkalitolerans]